ncbi:MAG: hypothetical protein JXI43_10350 [Tissierellales bacterium]|nr:hypothetical protein [Tissierellales bacterium]
MRVLYFVVVMVLCFVSCATVPPPLALKTYNGDFTKVQIFARTDIRSPEDYGQIWVFINSEVEHLCEAKAVLRFQDKNTGDYLPKNMELEYVGADKFRTVKTFDFQKEDIENYYLFVQFEYDKKLFLSNHIHPYLAKNN